MQNNLYRNLSSFVKPHLAIGSLGDHQPEMPLLPNRTGQNNSGANYINAAYQPQSANRFSLNNPNADDTFKPDFAKAVKLAPKQTVEIEISIEAADNFGLTFMADSQISATLLNDKGVIAGKNLTKTPESNGWFRSIFIDKPVTESIWKLKLENTSALECEALIAGWKNAVRK